MMKTKLCVTYVVLVSVLAMLHGCTGTGKRPFLMVQLCLKNEQGVALFKNTMISIARLQDMRYVDGSAATQEQLISQNANPNYKIIFIGVERNDTMGLTAGNLGLGEYQVAIGFSEGSSPAEAHHFADVVVRRLEKRWHVYVVPPGRGALPLQACEK